MKRTAAVFATVGVMLALFAITASAADVPVYDAQFAGPGISATMNDAGVTIGNDSTIYPGGPWVNDGSGPRPLPLPPGIPVARVSDINDAGTIVGTVYTDGQITSDLPAIWTPDGAGDYVVELLPLAGSATRATAVAINDVGQILASGFGIDGVLPTYRAYVIDGAAVVPLGLANPITINDNGIVLTNHTIFDYSTMTDLGLPAPPTGVSAIAMYPSDLNDNDQVIVTMLTTIISHTRYEVIGIYTLGVGWTTVTGVGFNFASGPMNDQGDFLVTGGACSMMVFLQGLGYYCPSSLLDPAETDWQVGRVLDIANDRTLLAQGSNTTTGESGTIRMTPIGLLPVPAAPIDVVVTPHVPTAQQNFVSLDLSWQPADTLTRSYAVERRGPGDVDFLAVASTTNRFYRDMDVVSGETYEYRVIAVGLAGGSEPSAVASAVAPGRGDTEAPVIVSISPQEGDVVSGVVTIEVTATDNVGVRLITVDAPGMRQRCDTWDSSTASCRWDTRELEAGPATIYVTASDAMNNGDFELVTVTVETTDGGGKGNGGGKGGGNGGGNGGGGGKGGGPKK